MLMCLQSTMQCCWTVDVSGEADKRPATVQDSRTYWFNASTLEAEDEFMLVGLVLGLAVYNAVLLDFPLPIALYRKLLGQPTGLRDLREMDPPLGRSLQGLLDLQGEPTQSTHAYTAPCISILLHLPLQVYMPVFLCCFKSISFQPRPSVHVEVELF